MPTPEDIETVSRAICAFHGIDPDAREHHFESEQGVTTRYGLQWVYYRDLAIAGLIASEFVKKKG